MRNLCVGCLDDQAVLLTLLHGQAERWRAATHFERRFAIQGYWEDYVGALPRAALAAPADGAAVAVAYAARRLRNRHSHERYTPRGCQPSQPLACAVERSPDSCHVQVTIDACAIFLHEFHPCLAVVLDPVASGTLGILHVRTLGEGDV